MSAILQIQGNFANTPGQIAVGVNISITTPVGAITATALANGANTISIPTGTTLILIQLPVGNATAVTLKGVTGDTGLPLNPVGVSMWQPKAAETSFVLTAGGAIATLTTITFL